MTRRNRWIVIFSGTLFLLVLAATFVPDMVIQRILFIAVIGVGIVTLIAYFFKSEAVRADQEGALEVQAALIQTIRADVADLQRLTYRQLAMYTAYQTDEGIDVDGAVRHLLAEGGLNG